MANDILFWAKESSCKPFQESLFLVSDQFRGDPYYVELLHHLVSGHLDIFFVSPTQDINKPESPEWPGLLIDEGAYRFLIETSGIPDEPCPKKRKADAGVLFMLEAEEETSGMDCSRL
ncbi:hypothetical protein Bca52824_095660 [Brassica carinata]|uniref:Uncharacterized protein n=1 Tax=Brassica carinata TaxID=52824 RepID=A0A8X7TI23_BRACI|nr:hypothetical protein Bca52824_095660 [Brassica carinata]